MTREEAVELCAYVEAACPSQQMAEFTPDVWHEIVPASFTLAECRAAVIAIVRRGERWVDVGAIIAEVRRVRNDIAEHGSIAVLRDHGQYRAAIEAADEQRRSVEAVVREIAIRAGRPAGLKAVPRLDYDGPAAIEAGKP